MISDFYSININSVLCVCVGVCLLPGLAEALSGGDQARQERDLQSLHVRLLLGGGDGATEGPVSRQPAALGADSPF